MLLFPSYMACTHFVRAHISGLHTFHTTEVLQAAPQIATSSCLPPRMANCSIGIIYLPKLSYQDGRRLPRPQRTPVCQPSCAAQCESRATSAARRQPDVILNGTAVSVHPDAVARRREAEQRSVLCCALFISRLYKLTFAPVSRAIDRLWL